MEEAHLSWKDQFLISPFGQWVDQHRNLLWNIGTVLLVLVIWGSIHLVRIRKGDSVRNVNAAIVAWKANMGDELLYHNVEKILDRSPRARLSIRSEMAQRLLSTGRCDEAEKWAKAPIQELRSIAPDHAEFAEISLLIGHKRYQEALERSVSLKEKLQGQQTVLVGRNLLRIAILHEQLGNKPGEIAAWKTWEEWIEAENNKTLQVSTLKGLGDQTIGFQSFVNERKSHF